MISAITFHEIKKEDILLVGGKGLALGEMTNAGFPVPEGFVVTSEVFDDFLTSNTIQEDIKKIISKLSIKNIENSSKRILALILNNSIDEKQSKTILDKFKDLNLLYVSVRSSATAEDNPKMSWAGQLETFLYVNRENLLVKIKECWSSLYSPRALTYRLEKNINGDVTVAVVIQKMIASEVSGIAFTVHPITKNIGEIFIEAGFGLGEYIVGGEITPDKYQVDKRDFAFLNSEVNAQTKMLVFDGNTTTDKKITLEEVRNQKLPGELIIELAKIAKKIEEHYKFPCDIEWALANNKLYILQSRPITTL
jgi:pyruvate,water dikinase